MMKQEKSYNLSHKTELSICSFRKRQLTGSPHLINAEIEVIMRIRAKGANGFLETSISNDVLSETSDLVENQLYRLSMNLLLDDITDNLYDILVDCLYGDDCENGFFDHKLGELNLNGTHQITGVFEESVFLAGAISEPSLPTTRSTLQTISTSKPYSDNQEMQTCSDSPELCAKFGILDLQVTCIDEIVDDQQQVGIHLGNNCYCMESWLIGDSGKCNKPNLEIQDPPRFTTTTIKSSEEIDPTIIWAPIVGVIGALLIGLGIFLIIYFRKRRATDGSGETFPNYETYGPYTPYGAQVGAQENERNSENSFDSIYEDAVYDEAPRIL